MVFVKNPCLKILLDLGCNFQSKPEKQRDTSELSAAWRLELLPVGIKVQRSLQDS